MAEYLTQRSESVASAGAIEPLFQKLLFQNPIRQSYQILHIGFSVAPMIAGLDKFINALADWDRYLDNRIPETLGVTRDQFLRGVGVVEILVGLGVALKPRIFGYILSGWLFGIIGNLILKRKFYDIALRDLGLALGALALARLSTPLEEVSAQEFAPIKKVA